MLPGTNDDISSLTFSGVTGGVGGSELLTTGSFSMAIDFNEAILGSTVIVVVCVDSDEIVIVSTSGVTFGIVVGVREELGLYSMAGVSRFIKLLFGVVDLDLDSICFIFFLLKLFSFDSDDDSVSNSNGL